MKIKREFHGMSNTKEYKIWQQMKRRCNDKNHMNYKYYGERGIKVCCRWQTFSNFYSDMGCFPGKGYSLERVDTSKNYSKSNCIWMKFKLQARNTRKNRRLRYNGKIICLQEASEISGIKRETIAARLNRGWSVEKAMTVDPNKYHNKKK